MIGDSGVFTSPRIDNVSSVSAILESLVRTGNKWKEERVREQKLHWQMKNIGSRWI